ncbi:hypothetical protein BJ742DRAFT_745681 [Cladochytrium replicatum]|nr:hypothetical protein BJ742DRAFT_745681 [Cladochytrium replicatum]
MHLSHLIRWSDLLYCISEPASGPNPVYMPSGDHCKRIHLVKKRHHLLVDQYPHLHQFVCVEDPCPSTELEDQLYRIKPASNTNHKTRITLRICAQDARPRLESFTKSFFDALKSVGDADLNRRFETPPRSLEQEIDDIEEDDEFRPSRDWDYEMAYCILARNRPDLVLKLHMYKERKIGDRHVFNPNTYVTQAIGNYWKFLMYYVLLGYICVNLALEAEESKNDASPINTSLERMKGWKRDCDGRCFLHTQRYALEDDVFMKDLDAMRSMAKELFRFMADFYVVQLTYLGEEQAQNWWLHTFPIVDLDRVLDIRMVYLYWTESMLM